MSLTTRRSSVKIKEDGIFCPDCNKVVADRDCGLECEVCELWFHSKCQKVSDDAYQCLSNNPTMHWYCSGCNKGVAKILQALAKVQAKQEKLEKDLNECQVQIKSFKEDVKAIRNEVSAIVVMAKATDDNLKDQVKVIRDEISFVGELA